MARIKKMMSDTELRETTARLLEVKTPLSFERELDAKVAEKLGLLVISRNWPYNDGEGDYYVTVDEYADPYLEYEKMKHGPVYLKWPHSSYPSFKDKDGTYGWDFSEHKINPAASGRYIAWPPKLDNSNRIVCEDLEIVPYYSTDLAAAIGLVITHRLSLRPLESGQWFCYAPGAWTAGDTLPLAICLCLLKVLEEKEKEEGEL